MASQNHTAAAALLRRCLFSPANQIIPSFHVLELSLAVAAFVLLHCLRQKQRYGVAVWPVLGMTPTLAAAARGDLYGWLTAVLRRRNGTFAFQGPWFTSLRGVVTCDPRNLEHLLKSNFANFPKGPYFRENVRDLLGDGIFGADHANWQRQRRVASLEFHSASFRRSTVDSLHDLVHARLLPVLDGACDGGAIDLQDVLLRLTFDNVCMIAFGVDPGCLRPGLPEIPFARAFEDATEATLNRFVTPAPVWKAMRWAGLGVEKRLKESIRCVDEFAAEVIRTRKKELRVSREAGGERADLLTAFMGMKEESGAAFSDKFLRDICVNFILAGRDTSSVALTWFFWLLDRNPAAEAKIMKEIRRVAAAAQEEGEFGPEEVKKMDYLQAALSESLRLYPSVPLDQKQVVEDDVFPDGTAVKKGTLVIYAIYAMGRMESIWGEDCREFRPERWLREGRFVAEPAYKFAAFNGGPRLCLGKDFAYYQMKFVAASVLRRFRVRVVERHPVTPKLSLTMYVKHGLRVVLSRRQGGRSK